MPSASQRDAFGRIPLSAEYNSKVCKSLIYTLFLFFEIPQMIAFDRQLVLLLMTSFQKSKGGTSVLTLMNILELKI
jgi:hypothetical protein